MKNILLILFLLFNLLSNAQRPNFPNFPNFPNLPNGINGYKNFNNQDCEITLSNGSTRKVDCKILMKCIDDNSCEELNKIIGNDNLGNNNRKLNEKKKNKNQSEEKVENTNNNAKDIFIEVIPSKTELFLGEQFSIVYRIYMKDGIKTNNYKGVGGVQFNSFYRQNVLFKQTTTQKNFNGTLYNVTKYLHYILTPIKSGKIIINPETIDIDYVKYKFLGHDWFGTPVYDRRGSSKKRNISSRSITINVKKLPKPEPKTFYVEKNIGIVGNDFKIESSTNTDTVKVGDAIRYIIKLRGKGNINFINPLPIDIPSNFKVFESEEIEDNTFKKYTYNDGSKTFQYLLTPNRTGTYTIPKINFHYFDPNQKRYIELSTKSHTIQVIKGDGKNKIIGSKITLDTNNTTLDTNDNISLKIKKTENFEKISSRNSLKKNYWRSFWTFIFLIIALILYNVYRKKSPINPIERKKRKSTKKARKRLKKARKYIKNDDFIGFFEETERSLWGYFSEKFNVPLSKLSKETINNHFSKNNVNEKIRDQFIQILESCEFARFSSSQNTNKKMEETLEEAKNIIIQVESTSK